MTNRRHERGPGTILGRGIGLGAHWGAVLGLAVVAVSFLANVLATGNPGSLTALPWYCPFAALVGAVVGVIIAAMVSIALIVAGAGVRQDRVRSRLLAGAVAAIPGVAAVWFALVSKMSGLSGWVILVGTVIAAVVAGAALAPRVAAPSASAPTLARQV